MGHKQSRPEYSPHEPDYAYPDYAFPDGSPALAPSPDPVQKKKKEKKSLFGRRRQQHQVGEVQEVQMDPYGYPIQQAEIYPPLQDPGQEQGHKKKKGLFSRRRDQEVHSEQPPDPSSGPPPPVPPKQAYQTYLSTRPHIQIHRSAQPPLLIPLTTHQPRYTPRRFLHPPQTVRLPKPGTFLLRNVRSGGAGLKRGSVERGSLRDGLRELRQGRRDGRGVERERRKGDAQREYAALKIQTEQDLYKASLPRRASRRRKNDQAGDGYEQPGYQPQPQPQPQPHPDQAVYGNIPTQTATPVQDPHYEPYQTQPEYDYQPYANEPHAPPIGGPGQGRSIWTKDRWTRTTTTRDADPIEESMNVSKSKSKKKVQWGKGGGEGFRGKHGMRHVDEEEVRDY